MSKKKLLILGVTILLLVNGSIFATVYVVEMLRPPTEAELATLREAEQKAALEAIYASLPPLPEFKSKIDYVRSMGEAIGLCEEKLHATVTVEKSWEVNMIESRYVPAMELYKIFMEYETLRSLETPAQHFKVTCEVSGEKKVVEVWKTEPV